MKLLSSLFRYCYEIITMSHVRCRILARFIVRFSAAELLTKSIVTIFFLNKSRIFMLLLTNRYLEEWRGKKGEKLHVLIFHLYKETFRSNRIRN